MVIKPVYNLPVYHTGEVVPLTNIQIDFTRFSQYWGITEDAMLSLAVHTQLPANVREMPVCGLTFIMPPGTEWAGFPLAVEENLIISPFRLQIELPLGAIIHVQDMYELMLWKRFKVPLYNWALPGDTPQLWYDKPGGYKGEPYEYDYHHYYYYKRLRDLCITTELM